MSDLLPEALQAMLKHASETHSAGDLKKAEIEYFFAVEYSSKIYHLGSTTTGLVLLHLINFLEETNQRFKAAIVIGRVNAILAGYKV